MSAKDALRVMTVGLRSRPLRTALSALGIAIGTAAIVAVLGHFLFGEPFGIKQIGGIVLIMGGVVLINQT